MHSEPRLDGTWARRLRRAAPFALALALGGLGSTTGHGASDPPSVVDDGLYVTPLLGRRLAVRHDVETREKWLQAADGSRYASVEAATAAELATLSPRDRVLDRELRARLDAAGDDEAVDVVLVFGRQPVSEIADAVAARTGPAITAAGNRGREIVGRIAARRPAGVPAGSDDENVYLTADERTELESCRTAARDGVRAMRREIIDRARPLARSLQEDVIAALEALPDALVLGRSTTLSTVSARMRAADVADFVLAHGEIARAELVQESGIDLNTAVSVIGASSWWNAGYNGSSTTKVAILDTGVDSGHPALSNVVSDNAVYLSAGSQQSNFNDNASSTDDLQFHGTHCAGIAASTDSTYTGVAYGGRVMNGKCGYLTTSGGGSLISTDIYSAADWAGDNGADVLSCSFGSSGTTYGTSSDSTFFDAQVADLAIAVTVAAGNSGSSSGTLLRPADGFNVIAVANFNDNGTTSLSDDSLNSTSSRGPTSDGRRKPDIAAPGTNIASAYNAWEGNNPDFVNASGTSMACPMVAGSLALLIDAGVASYPEGMKALLLTNTRNTSPVATSPDDNWGYGAIDLSTTYTNRAALYEGTLSSSGDRYLFVKASTLASGKRITLCWNRRVVSNNASVPTTSSTLLDCDLYVYEESSGASAGSSTSSVDSVEQVALSSSVTTPVIKVYRASSSFPSGLTTQRVAIAAEQSGALTSVTAPSLSVALNSFASTVAAGTSFTVTATVTNNGGLKAQSPSVTLTLPTGYSISSGSNPQTISSLAAGANAAATWTVTAASSDGSYDVQAAASSTTYGETFTSSTASRSQTVDATAPTGTVTIAGGAAYVSSNILSLALSASDASSGVADMRIRESGGTWSAWVGYTTSSALTVSSTDGTKTVEAQFRDAVGNVSSTASDTVVLDTTAPTGTVDIESGAAWTNSLSVSLALSASDAGSGVADVRSSNDARTWSSWTTYAASLAHTLTSTEGTRTVYVQFRDAVGNVSATSSDTIGLDRTSPSGTISVESGATYATSATVDVALSSSDALSGVTDVRFSEDGEVYGSWMTALDTVQTTLTGGDGSYLLYAQYRDAAGNVSSPTSDDIVLDTTAPAGTLAIDGGASWTNTRSVTLTLQASDGGSGLSEMRFSNDGETWGVWQTYQSNSSWSLADQDGTSTVYAQVRDVAGNVSSNLTDTIGLDRGAPTGAVSIEAGAAWTNTRDVGLTLTSSDDASGVVAARFSNDGEVWSAWEEFSPSDPFPWTLANAQGTVTVFAEFQDLAGNVSETTSDDIGLDTISPEASVFIEDDADWTTHVDVELIVEWLDSNSGAADMRFSNDGTTWSAWQTVAVSAAWTLTAQDGTRTVYVQVRDVAGNVSNAETDTIGLDTVAPAGTLVIDGGAAWTADLDVALTPVATDATSGVADMRFSDDGQTWTAWTKYAGSAAWTLPGPDGTPSVYAQFRDVAGNVSTSVSDAIGLDRVAPTGALVIAGGADWVGTRAVTLSPSGSDATSGVAEMRFSDDGTTWSAWETYAASTAWTLPDQDGTNTVYGQVRDAAGNVSTAFSDAVGLDRVAPSGSVLVDDDATWTTTTDVTLALDATDALSGVTAARFSNDGAVWSAWTTIAATADWALAAGDGTHTVYVQFQDAAGNTSADATDDIGLDETAPAGSVSIDADAATTRVTAVTLTLATSDATSGVSDLRLSNDGATWGAWLTPTTSIAWDLVAGDGTRTVYLQVRDVAGNVSAAFTDTILADATPPVGALAIAGDVAWVGGRSVTLSPSASDDGSGVADMRFSADGATWTAWETYTGSAPWTLADADGQQTVYAQYRDAAGNESDVVSDDIGLDRAGPAGSLTIAGGADWTTTLDVTLTPGATDPLSGVFEMRFSDDGATWSSWQGYSTTAPWTLAAQDGTRTVYAQYRDAVGNVSTASSDTIGLDRVAPTGTLALDSGAPWTRTTAVTAGLTGSDTTSGVAEFRLSNDGATWSAWAAFAASSAWTLEGADGSRLVYAQLRDVAGNVSGAFTDAIVLDRAPPTGSVAIEGGDAATALATVMLGVQASDATTAVAEMRFSNDDGATWTAWQEIADSASLDLAAGEGTRRVHVQFRDVVGNESEAFEDEILADRTAPTGTLALVGGAEYLKPGVALVAALTADDGAGAGVADMRWSHDDGATWSPWTAFAAETDVGLPDTVDDVRHVVTFELRDAVGNVSEHVTSSIHVLARTPQDLTGAKSVRGALDVGGDVDAYCFELEAGDTLDVRASARPTDRGADADVVFDLFDPTGAQVVDVLFPADASRAGIKGYVAATTGRHLLVVRAVGADAAAGLTYTVSSKLKTTRAAPVVGADEVGDIAFATAAHRRIKAALRGALSADAELVGPFGDTPLALRGGRRGRWSLPTTELLLGSGPYVLQVRAADDATPGVQWKLKVSPPRRVGRVDEVTTP